MRVLPLLPAAALAGTLALTASDTRAGCSTGGFMFLPSPKSDLPANGRVVVEGYGEVERFVTGLRDDALALASETDAIPLRVVEIQHGGAHVSQAILAPTRPPTPGTRYSLRASAQGSPLDEKLRKAWNVPTWKAADALGTGPRWTARPPRGVPEVDRGCPGHAYVRIRVPIQSPERLLGVIAEVRPLVRGATPSRYLLPVYDGGIALGFTGCESPVPLVPGVTHCVFRSTRPPIPLPPGHSFRSTRPGSERSDGPALLRFRLCGATWTLG